MKNNKLFIETDINEDSAKIKDEYIEVHKEIAKMICNLYDSGIVYSKYYYENRKLKKTYSIIIDGIIYPIFYDKEDIRKEKDITFQTLNDNADQTFDKSNLHRYRNKNNRSGKSFEGYSASEYVRKRIRGDRARSKFWEDQRFRNKNNRSGKSFEGHSTSEYVRRRMMGDGVQSKQREQRRMRKTIPQRRKNVKNLDDSFLFKIVVGIMIIIALRVMF